MYYAPQTMWECVCAWTQHNARKTPVAIDHIEVKLVALNCIRLYYTCMMHKIPHFLFDALFAHTPKISYCHSLLSSFIRIINSTQCFRKHSHTHTHARCCVCSCLFTYHFTGDLCRTPLLIEPKIDDDGHLARNEREFFLLNHWHIICIQPTLIQSKKFELKC